MTNEDLILERLDRIEGKLAPLTESVRNWKEFQADATPLANQAVQLMIKELRGSNSKANAPWVVASSLRFK